MIGNCIIEVTQEYLTSVEGVIEFCHQRVANDYRKKMITGYSCCDTCETSLENLLCLSDLLFYLKYFNINEDDCKFVHLVKEQAMTVCKFTESDITDNLFLNSILLEDGSPIIGESNLIYLQLEDS